MVNKLLRVGFIFAIVLTLLSINIKNGSFNFLVLKRQPTFTLNQGLLDVYKDASNIPISTGDLNVLPGRANIKSYTQVVEPFTLDSEQNLTMNRIQFDVLPNQSSRLVYDIRNSGAQMSSKLVDHQLIFYIPGYKFKMGEENIYFEDMDVFKFDLVNTKITFNNQEFCYECENKLEDMVINYDTFDVKSFIETNKIDKYEQTDIFYSEEFNSPSNVVELELVKQVSNYDISKDFISGQIQLDGCTPTDTTEKKLEISSTFNNNCLQIGLKKIVQPNNVYQFKLNTEESFDEYQNRPITHFIKYGNKPEVNELGKRSDYSYVSFNTDQKNYDKFKEIAITYDQPYGQKINQYFLGIAFLGVNSINDITNTIKIKNLEITVLPRINLKNLYIESRSNVEQNCNNVNSSLEDNKIVLDGMQDCRQLILVYTGDKKIYNKELKYPVYKYRADQKAVIIENNEGLNSIDLQIR